MLANKQNLDLISKEITKGNNSLILKPHQNIGKQKCSIYVKENSNQNDYHLAFCDENKPCIDFCHHDFEINGLYANTIYNIKIIPEKAYKIQIYDNIKTSRFY